MNAEKHEEPFYLTYLREELHRRTGRSKNYSLRAFARDLSMPPSTLSRILNHERPVPKKMVEPVSTALKLTGASKKKFADSCQDSLTKNRKRSSPVRLLSIDEAEIFTNWEYLCVLSLFDAPDFSFEKNHISQRLHVTKKKAKTIIDNLVKKGFVYVANGRHRRRFNHLLLNDESRTIQTMELKKMLRHKSRRAPQAETIELSITTFYSTPEDLQKLRKIIRQLELRAQRLSIGKSGGDVYELVMDIRQRGRDKR